MFKRKSHNNDRVVSESQHAVEVAKAWGIDEELWDRSWGNLSGGESQRIALATAVGLRSAEVLLLDGTFNGLLRDMN